MRRFDLKKEIAKAEAIEAELKKMQIEREELIHTTDTQSEKMRKLAHNAKVAAKRLLREKRQK